MKKSQDYNYKMFWIFIIVYSFGYLAKASDLVNSQIHNLIMLVGVIGFVYFFIKLKRFKIEHKYLRILFLFYYIWQVYIIFRGLQVYQKNSIYWYLFYPFTLLSYLVPLVILIPFKTSYLKTIFNNFTNLAVVLFFFIIVFIPVILENNNFAEQVIWTLGTGSGFLILTIEYQNKLRKIIAYAAVLISLLMVSFLARRNIMLTFMGYIIFSYLIYIFNSNQTFKTRLKKILLFLFIVLGISITFLRFQDTVFANLTSRISDNSRAEVFIGYFLDMNGSDWVIGRGMEGTYYQPGVDEGEVDRYLIENGYLYMILKGGLIDLFLFLFIAVPAAYLGLTKSKNIVSKAAGALVFLWLVDMVAWGMPAINIRYILLWVSISICYTTSFRELTDNEVKENLYSI